MRGGILMMVVAVVLGFVAFAWVQRLAPALVSPPEAVKPIRALS